MELFSNAVKLGTVMSSHSCSYQMLPQHRKQKTPNRVNTITKENLLLPRQFISSNNFRGCGNSKTLLKS